MKSVISFLFFCVITCEAVTDLTLVANSNGRFVVESALSILQEPCIFVDDAQFLRRWAKASSDDGQSAVTFSSGFYGGIWQITQSQYTATKSVSNAIKNDIQAKFGIDWDASTWEDLLKPLYSVIATRILIHQKHGASVPISLADQATSWSELTGQSASVYTTADASISSVCDGAADIVFLVDGSGSIDSTEYGYMKAFMKNLVQNINVAADKTRVGLVVYSTNVHPQFTLSQYLTVSELLPQIDGIERPRRYTRTDKGLDYVMANSFTAANGGRDWATDVLITITDGVSTEQQKTLDSAAILKTTDIRSFVVGVGDNLAQIELEAIASDENCNYLTILKDFLQFDNVINQIEKRICNVKTAIQDGTTTDISEDGVKYYTYTVSEACTRLQISITGGTAIIYYGTGFQPSPAKYDTRSDLIPAKDVYLLASASGQIYITIVANARATVTFNIETNQCICPDGSTSQTITSPFSDCLVDPTTTTTTTTAAPSGGGGGGGEEEEEEGIGQAVSGYDCGSNSPCMYYGLEPIVPNKFHYPHADPTKFVQCTLMICYIMPCSPGLTYDDSIQTCR